MHYALNVEIEDDGTHIAFFLDGEEEMMGFICAPEEFTAMAKARAIHAAASALNNLEKALHCLSVAPSLTGF